MNVALLGATGFVGSAVLKEAVDRGHVVTAIVRHPEKLEKREGLTAKAGDVYDTASLATLIRGNEAIISAFNPGWKNPNLYDDQVRGTASIIVAIKKAGIKRVLWVGGAGGLEVKPGVRVIDSPDMPLWVKPGSLATINALDQLRKEPELEWSFLSPSAELKPGQRTGKFRLGNDQLLVDGMDRLWRNLSLRRSHQSSSPFRSERTFKAGAVERYFQIENHIWQAVPRSRIHDRPSSGTDRIAAGIRSNE